MVNQELVIKDTEVDIGKHPEALGGLPLGFVSSDCRSELQEVVNVIDGLHLPIKAGPFHVIGSATPSILCPFGDFVQHERKWIEFFNGFGSAGEAVPNAV